MLCAYGKRRSNFLAGASREAWFGPAWARTLAWAYVPRAGQARRQHEGPVASARVDRSHLSAKCDPPSTPYAVPVGAEVRTILPRSLRPAAGRNRGGRLSDPV